MKLNKPLIRKMIKRIEAMPETYDQRDFGYRVSADFHQRPVPACGYAACLAGEAVICNAKTVLSGIRALNYRINQGGVTDYAVELIGVPNADLFCATGLLWPEPYASRFLKATTYKQEARIAGEVNER